MRPPCWYLCSDCCDLTRLNSTDPAATRLPLLLADSLFHRITFPEKLLSPPPSPLVPSRRRKVRGVSQQAGREVSSWWRHATFGGGKKGKKHGGKPLRQARLISGVYADRNVARLASRPRGTEEQRGWGERQLYYAVCCDCRWCRHIAGRVRCNK